MIWLPILASALIISWAAWSFARRIWFGGQPVMSLLWAAVALLAVWVAWANIPARAHESDTGFRYDGACCSDKDCRPADPGEVKEAPGGWLVVPSGIFIPHGDLRLHDAPDGRFHVCNKTAGDRTTAPWCVYVPSFGS